MFYLLYKVRKPLQSTALNNRATIFMFLSITGRIKYHKSSTYNQWVKNRALRRMTSQQAHCTSRRPMARFLSCWNAHMLCQPFTNIVSDTNRSPHEIQLYHLLLDNGPNTFWPMITTLYWQKNVYSNEDPEEAYALFAPHFSCIHTS